MRWVSFTSGEYAFLSIAGLADGVIAIGGTARGVIAIGGIVSIGVVSIGMNAAGSMVALGMNAIAPISFSLINGLGIYSRAGVNSGGAWSNAGVNASGISVKGGVNSDKSWIPALIVIAVLVVASSVVRGERTPRPRDRAKHLRRFQESTTKRAMLVKATLVSISGDAIEISDGSSSIVAKAGPAVLGAARALEGRSVHCQLRRVEEEIADEQAGDYRERPRTKSQTVVTATMIAAPPEEETWLPASGAEAQWVISWTARLAAIASVGALVYLMRS